VGGASKVEADDPADVSAPVDEAVATGDADRAIVLLSAAIRDLTARGERRRAAMACARSSTWRGDRRLFIRVFGVTRGFPAIRGFGAIRLRSKPSGRSKPSDGMVHAAESDRA
jgi:hypothetical protein